jgi:hypothetical protein
MLLRESVLGTTHIGWTLWPTSLVFISDNVHYQTGIFTLFKEIHYLILSFRYVILHVKVNIVGFLLRRLYNQLPLLFNMCSFYVILCVRHGECFLWQAHV